MRRLALIAALALAGCGSTKAAPPQAPAATAAPAARASATIKDFTFRPSRLAVAAGAKVTWTNRDTANHNVTFDDQAIPNLREGDSASLTFAKPGTYEYVCTYHPGMEGTVSVRPAS